MIVTGTNGRRRSIHTTDDDIISFRDGYALCTPEERSLIHALLNEHSPDDAAALSIELNESLYRRPLVSMQQFIEDPYYLGDSMGTMYPALKQDVIDLFSAPYREVLLTGSIGSGKCVDGDTELYDPIAGLRVTVKEASLVDGFGVSAWDGSNGAAHAARAAMSGYKPLGWLELESGVRVRMSPDHPVRTPWGYTVAADLRAGDMVASLRRLPSPVKPLDVSDDIVTWVAYMLADGGSTTHSMTFTNADPRIHDEFALVTMALSHGGHEDEDVVKFIRNDGKARTVRPNGMQWLQHRYDLQHPAKHKRVPAKFYGLSDRQLALFLNRIWACDGWLTKSSNDVCEVGISLASEAFIRDLQQLLLRLGIRSHVRPRTMHYTHNGERRSKPAWSLNVTDGEGVIAFLDAVGDVYGKEDICRRLRTFLSDRKRNPNADITPMDRSTMSRLRREIGPISKKSWWPGTPKDQRLGHPTLVRLRETYPLPEWCRWWPDVFWDRVTSYEPGTVMEPVYDVEVPGVANFAPGGLIVHNTFLASAAICRILYELSCMKNPQMTFGMSPGTEMVIMLISKNLVLAREVMKTSIDDKIKLSPYFMQHFTPKFSTDYTLFPNSIRMNIGSYGAERALGANIFSAFLDECLGKKSLLSIGGHGKSAQFPVGDLWAMGPAGRDGLLVEALDHATGQQTWTPFRMRLSTVQPLVRIETNLGSCVRAIEPSREHPLLVRRDEWLIYVPAREIVVGDEVVWRRDDGEEGREVVGGAATEVVGGSEEADGGTQSILGEDAQRGDQSVVCGECAAAVDGGQAERGDQGQAVGVVEGACDVCGDEGQDGGVGQGALYAGVAGEAGGYHEGACRCRIGFCATAPSGRTGSSEPGTEADGGTAAADERGVPRSSWPRAQRGIAGQDFGGECAGDQGSSAVLPLPCVVAGWRLGALPDGEREASGSTAVHGKRCGAHCRRRSDGVDALRVRWKEKDDDWRLLSDKERWRASISGGERFGTSLSRQGTCALGSRMEVVPGEWALDDPCGERSAHSECMDGTVCDGGVHGERAETSRALSHHVDGRSLGGCRFECLRVSDLSDAYQLARVTATRDLPSEQTYSIETDCQTFVADGCVVHNTNFPPKRSAQQINQTFGKKLTAANFDVVEKVYRSMVRRIKSRFQIAGGDFPGMVIMVSSAATLDSFTERKLRDARHDPTIFVRDHTAWTSKPKDHFCGKWFYVLCSKSSLRSRILDDGEYDEISQEYLQENNAWLIEVPVEYRDDFESNLEDSLRDIAGVSTQAISAFFQRVDAIDACIAKDRKHPFSSEVWMSGSPATFDWNLLCRQIERRLPGGFTETAWAPKEAPSSPRWIHIDTSISGDSTGFCCGRIDRWVEVVRRDGDGHAYTDTAPYYVIEVILCIRPPTGDQIYMPDLRRLVYELQAHGFPIHGFSSDSFQYVEMHQQIRRHGIHTELISMDRTIDPYEELKSAIYEKRIEFYDYTPLLQELRSLEYDRVKGKIDHPRHSCFTGDTRIALADGTCPTFRELSLRDGEFHVYSMGPEGVRISPARHSRVTMVAHELLEVLLDNFQMVRCTPEHLFMTLDQEWIQAQHLTPDVRLMPLYRVVADMGGTGGYERVWCPIRRERLLTHRLAVGLPPNGTIVHHLDRNKTNNDPKNLAVMSRSEHYSHHGNELWDQRRDALRSGHKRYVEERGRDTSREVMLRTWEQGKFGPRRAVCAVEGCERTSNARGMCDMHYQRAKRRGVLPERMEKLGENHRVLRVTRVPANEEVYDITVPGTENFALATGVFVHNSKDLGDALAGVVWGLKQQAARLPWAADADTPNKVFAHDHGWVSDMIPAEDVDVDDVRAARSATAAILDIMPPFFIGDD